MILGIKFMFKNINYKKNNSGQVMMVVVLILSGIIIGATAISGLLTARQIRQTADSGSSAMAIAAADAGLEWRMYKLYEDWKMGTLVDGDCIDCQGGTACDKQPQFSEKINNTDVNLSVACTPVEGADPDFMYFNIKSIAKVQSTSYSFEQTVKFSK